jgi:hypothetical protein
MIRVQLSVSSIKTFCEADVQLYAEMKKTTSYRLALPRGGMKR